LETLTVMIFSVMSLRFMVAPVGFG